MLSGIGTGTLIAQDVVETERGGYFPIHGVQHASHSGDELRRQAISTAKRLKKEGRLSISNQRSNLEFIHPLKPLAEYAHNSYYGISFFMDHDPTHPFGLQDYACQERTYDGVNYNHSGTDYFLYPFPWNLMDEEVIAVVAAEDGHIVSKQDGYYDRSCNVNTGEISNAVFIVHDNDIQSGYLHLKKNSLTSKITGDFVEKGEIIGFVGSSGASSGPHLHFEVFEPAVDPNPIRFIDPFAGSCNVQSLWEEQEPYYNSMVNRASTHFEKVEFTDRCDADIINESNEFCYGDSVYLYGFYRDVFPGQVVIHRVTNPFGTTFVSMVRSTDVKDYQETYYTIEAIRIPDDAPEGTWKYTILYQSNGAQSPIVEHEFDVCMSTSLPKHTLQSVKIYPNPAREVVYVELEKETPNVAKIILMNVDGRVLIQENIQGRYKHFLPVQNISQGLYLVAFVDADSRIIGSRRFVKE